MGENGLILTSDDGHFWENRSAFFGHHRDLAYNDARLVVVGAGIFTSEDGLEWQQRTFPGDQDLVGVAWDGSRFITIDSRGDLYHSEFGIHWSATGNHLSGRFQDLDYVVGKLFVSGQSGIHAVVWVLTENGWQQGFSSLFTAAPADKSLITNIPASNVVFDGSRYLALGDHTLWHSQDGENWQPGSTLPKRVERILYRASGLLVLADYGLATFAPIVLSHGSIEEEASCLRLLQERQVAGAQAEAGYPVGLEK